MQTISIKIYGGPQLSRQKQNARVKSKTLASKAKQSRQKQNHGVKSETVASKAKQSRQKQNSRVKSKDPKCIRAIVSSKTLSITRFHLHVFNVEIQLIALKNFVGNLPTIRTELASITCSCQSRDGIQKDFQTGICPHLVSLRFSSRNMRFADDHPEVIDAYLTMKLSCGPFRLVLRSSVRSTLLLQSSWGDSEENEPGKWRLILELFSAPAQSVNDGNSSELYSLHYTSG